MAERVNKRPKFFYTSDRKFLINVEKIAFIESEVYSAEPVYTKSEDKVKRLYTYTYKSSKNDYCVGITDDPTDKEKTGNTYLSLYKNYNFAHASYFNVYVEGCESPLKLKYADGMMLINFMASDSFGGIFTNTVSGNYSNMQIYDNNTYQYFEGQAELDNSTYKCVQMTIPYNMLNLKSYTCVSKLTDLTFYGQNIDSSYEPGDTIAVLTEKIIKPK